MNGGVESVDGAGCDYPGACASGFFLGRWGSVGVGLAGNGGNGAKDHTLRLSPLIRNIAILVRGVISLLLCGLLLGLCLFPALLFCSFGRRGLGR